MGILFLLPCIRRELPVAGPVGGILRKTDVQDRLFYGQLKRRASDNRDDASDSGDEMP